jgi:hypothetical protein
MASWNSVFLAAPAFAAAVRRPVPFTSSTLRSPRSCASGSVTRRTTWWSNPGTKGEGCGESRGDREQQRSFTWRECNESRSRSSWSTSGR